MTKTTKILSAALFVSFAGIASAHAAEADSDLFVLKSGVSAQTISYDDARKVRICLDDSKATRPLRVSHGLGSNVIEPGSCYTFESSEFRVSARGINADYQMVGRVQHLD